MLEWIPLMERVALKNRTVGKGSVYAQNLPCHSKTEDQMSTATRGKWRGVTDAALGAIVAHPVRCRLLATFADRVASPTEAAQELNMPVGDVSYHVRTLKDAGVIELVDERPVRGSTEHFYRATVSLNLTEEEYAALSMEERDAFARQTFHIVAAE